MKHELTQLAAAEIGIGERHGTSPPLDAVSVVEALRSWRLDEQDATALLTAVLKEMFLAGARYVEEHREDEYGWKEAMYWLHDHGLPLVKVELE